MPEPSVSMKMRHHGWLCRDETGDHVFLLLGVGSGVLFLFGNLFYGEYNFLLLFFVIVNCYV